jgi:hypothetical protein
MEGCVDTKTYSSLTILEVHLYVQNSIISSSALDSKDPQLRPVTLQELFGTRCTQIVVSARMEEERINCM